jgi:hypothetical protein
MSDWKSTLQHALQKSSEKSGAAKKRESLRQLQVANFFALTMEAFEELKVELERTVRQVVIDSDNYTCTIDVYNGIREFSYSVMVRPSVKRPLYRILKPKRGYGHYRNTLNRGNDVKTRFSVRWYSRRKISGLQKDQIIHDFLVCYQRQLAMNNAKKSKQQMTLKVWL